MTSKPDSTAAGVALAFGEWLLQHDVTVPDVLEIAIGRTFGKWLDRHSGELIAAVAEAAAKRAGGAF